LQALRVAKSKLLTYESAVYHQRLTYRVAAHEQCLQAAKSFMTSHTKIILNEGSGEQVIRQFNTFYADIHSRGKLDESSSAVLGFLNWVSQTSIKVAARTAQALLMSCVISASPRNTGLVLMPLFTYKKGQLWMLEQAATKTLATSSMNVDRSFVLHFGTRVDARDTRPLIYPGRVHVPNNSLAVSLCLGILDGCKPVSGNLGMLA